jgi:acyl-CoA thioester hydrolase
MSNSADTIRPSKPIPSSGALRVRVRYCECDPMGVVHHGAYIPWLEMGRTELLRDAGVSYAQLEAAGVFLVIVKLEASYKRPGFYDDLVEVRTRVVGGSRVKILHEYEVVRVEAAGGHLSASGITPGQGAMVGDVLIEGSSMLACVDRSGRPCAMPEWLVPRKEERKA